MSLDSFEARFAVLDEIPESLFSTVVTHTHGSLLTRARGVMQWRDALLAGRLPDEKALCWPDENLRRSILMRLEALDIVRYCRDEEELTDEILGTILEGVASAEDYFRKAGDFDDRIAQQQKIRDRDSEFEDKEGVADHVDSGGGNGQAGEGQPRQKGETADAAADGKAAATAGDDAEGQAAAMAEAEAGDGSAAEAGSSEARIAEISDDASGEAEADASESGAAQSMQGSMPDPLGDELNRRWGELAMSWRELSGVLDELGMRLGRGWDLTQGVLASQGWRDIARYRRLVAELPELAKLVGILGRMQDASAGDAEQSLTEAVADPLRREPDEIPRKLAEHAVATTEGVRLSDDIARMLPVESALLGHDRLNTLWHARRAESMLRCYQLQGVLSQHTPEPDPEEDRQAGSEGEQAGHGPVIVCLDSSASMAGEPETIAKAVTLEALRIAASESRDCLVMAFSGEGQMLRWRLRFGRGHYRELLEFLQCSFHGGTDVVGALGNALDELANEAWRQADILLISDGRFPLPDEIMPRVNRAKEKYGLRLHGLLVGRWRGQTMQRLCDPLHRFDVWHEGMSMAQGFSRQTTGGGG